MNPIGDLLYQTNNPTILTSEYFVRPPSSQKIGLARDANVDVSLDTLSFFVGQQ